MDNSHRVPERDRGANRVSNGGTDDRRLVSERPLEPLAFWHDLRSSEIVRISAGYEHAWPLSVDSQVLNDLVQPARSNLSLDQARWEYESSVQRTIMAVANANERGLTQSHYGEVGLGTTHDLGHAEAVRKWRQERGT